MEPHRNHLTTAERATLSHFIVVGRELADVAAVLRARYLTAHLALADEALAVFTVEDGRVSVTGQGCDVELSALPAYWQQRN